MTYKAVLAGLAALSLAIPATAQERGSIDFRGRTVIVDAPMLAPARIDVAIADSTRRLHDRDAELTRLRDSLNRAPAESAEGVLDDKIHFAFDRADLNDDALALLDDRIASYRVNRSLRVLIVGHTDVPGSVSFDYALDERRAQAAKCYLVAHGIPAEKVIVSSKGDSEPITPKPGKVAQAPNRRDEIRVTVMR